MQHLEPQRRAKRGFIRNAGAALLIFGGTLAAAVAGGASSKPGLWYRRLHKPAGTPPNIVFPVVWTALYAGMAFSAWRVWQKQPSVARTRSLALWTSQLALNAAWSPVFFGAHKPKVAFGVIGALLPAIGAYTLSARKVDRTAASLMLPYLAWVSFATYLNAGIVKKNW